MKRPKRSAKGLKKLNHARKGSGKYRSPMKALKGSGRY